jgi:SAM-dependent methyltransferase
VASINSVRPALFALTLVLLYHKLHDVYPSLHIFIHSAEHHVFDVLMTALIVIVSITRGSANRPLILISGGLATNHSLLQESQTSQRAALQSESAASTIIPLHVSSAQLAPGREQVGRIFMDRSANLSPDQTPQGWNDVVEKYEAAAEPFTSQFSEEAIGLVRIEPGQRILDVAAGTGALTLAAARHEAEVVAVDFSPAMVSRLRGRLNEEKLTNTAVEQMDGQALTFVDNSFDLAFSVFGVIFFPDHAKGLQEMRRASSAAWLWQHLPGMSPGLSFVFDKLSAEQTDAFGKAFIEQFKDGPVAVEGEAHVGIGVK